MPTVERLLANRDCRVITIEPTSTVLDAAMMMNEHRIGSLVVTDRPTIELSKGQRDNAPRRGPVIVGIITERDVMTRLVAEQRDPATTRIADIMTAPVMTCGLHTTLEELRRIMRQRRIRHMPVLDDAGALCGMVSIGDLNTAQEAVMEETIRMLEIYNYRP